ncbi:MAG: hypothetical protein Aurels2KO_21660 [Aureliella sp.]
MADVEQLEDVTEDLEECAKVGRRPRCAHRYRIKIDGQKYVAKVTFMLWQQLLELAGRCNPEEWHLFQLMASGELVQVKPGQKVDFTEPGIEQFFTLKCAPSSKFCLSIEGVKHPWSVSTITVEQIAEVGGWDVAEGVIQIDSDNNERKLEPGDVVTLTPGVEFCKNVRWKRGVCNG